MSVKQNNKNKTQKIILFTFVFIIGYLLLVTAITPKQYSLKEGDIPKVDIKAPRDTVDEKATKEKEDQALEKVGKQYTLKTEIKKAAEENTKALFDKLIILSATSNSTVDPKESDKITELKKLTEFQLTEEQCKVLISIPKDNLADLETKVINIIDKVYEKNINENDEVAIQGARGAAILEIDALKLENEVSNVLKPIIQTQINAKCFF